MIQNDSKNEVEPLLMKNLKNQKFRILEKIKIFYFWNFFGFGTFH